VTRRGRAGAAGAALLALVGCTIPGAAAPPPPPAQVGATWPGCRSVGAFPDPYAGDGPPGVGGIPDGFLPQRAVLCERGERANARGETVSVELERTATAIAPLLTYLARPSERPTEGACPAIAVLPPWLFLLDETGRYVAPAIPRDACGLPLGWQSPESAWSALSYTDRVVREGG
jgi:hypothetical protein